MLAIMIFASTASILSGLYSAPAAFSSSGDFVVMSPDAPTIFSSRVEVGLAASLMSVENVTSAWPEILAFSTWNGHSFVVRGMDPAEFPENLYTPPAFDIRVSPEQVISTRALIGARLLDRVGIEVPAVLPLTGSYASRMALVEVDGWFETGSYLDDELLVSLDVARHLTGTPDDMASVISVSTDNSEWLAKVLSPDTPRFVLFDVQPQTTTVVAGEVFSITMSVRNWGSQEGGVTVLISDGGTVLDEYSTSLMPGSTASLSRNVSFASTGHRTLDVSISGDFPVSTSVDVSVVDPYLTVSAPSRTIVGEPFTATARKHDGRPAVGATVQYSVDGDSGEAKADGSGEVQLTMTTSGVCILIAELEGYDAGTKSVEVVDLSAFPDQFLPVVRSFSVSPISIVESESIVATTTFENTGAVPGTYTTPLLLDSRTYATVEISLGPAEVKSVSVTLDVLSVGVHTVQLGAFSHEIAVEPWYADEPDLVQLVVRYGGSGVLSSSSSIPIYQAAKISEGNVAVALFSIGAVSALLASLAISAVFAKEIHESRGRLGILRTIGASNSQIRHMVLPQALGYGLIGAMVGIALGLAVTVWLSGSGAFFVFGHQLSITVDASLLLLTAVAAVAISVCSAFVSAEVAARETPIASIKKLEPEPLPEQSIEELLGEG
ncbi:TPA: FtsX-like permease family protein [Thermoplasmata archaeon]|nr:FtsX-like permease family protein [Thermoplasmata archaeon]